MNTADQFVLGIVAHCLSKNSINADYVAYALMMLNHQECPWQLKQDTIDLLSEAGLPH